MSEHYNNNNNEHPLKIKDYITIYDYYDQPLSFTFITSEEDKVYYSRLVDYEESTRTDIFWVNETSLPTIKEAEKGKITLYELMTMTDKVFILKSNQKGTQVEFMPLEEAMGRYAQCLPDREAILVDEFNELDELEG